MSVEKSTAEQAAALAKGGVAVLWIETMSSVEETEAAIAGARQMGMEWEEIERQIPRLHLPKMRFEQSPITVHVLCVYIATHIFAGVVIDPIVKVSVTGKTTITFAPVGIDGAATDNGIENVAVQ